MRKNYKCVCGKDFFSKNINPRFCSLDCKYKTGHSQETREKIKTARANQVFISRPILRSGYIYLKSWGHPFCGKQGYVAEHRLVIERHIGRFLNPEETIHHRDGNKTNNNISNLELFATRGEHTKHAHPEVRKKSTFANQGKRRSIKTEFKKGQTPWNKKVA